MEFRLTYEGILKGAGNRNSQTENKHQIRRVFHRQLRHLWQTEPYLRTALYTKRDSNPEPKHLRKSLVEHVRSQYSRLNYDFIPLVSEELRLYCDVDILFLRPHNPGAVLQSGDIDNRLKTLFDAMRMPSNKEELGGHYTPEEDEKPFYVLLTDDKLITKVSVETDRLLEPTAPYRGNNDSRLVITVRLKPYDMGWDNLNFS